MGEGEGDGDGDGDEGFVVRIRGLPWSASAEEVANFLEGNYQFLSICWEPISKEKKHSIRKLFSLPVLLQWA